MTRRFFELLSLMTYKIGFYRPWLNKRALVSYVSTLPIYCRSYFIDSHNSKLTCYLICKFLNSKGYSVDLRRCDDLNINIDKKYSLFIGHTSTFPEIKKRINLCGKSILLTTGSEPAFGNDSQKRQADLLLKRKGVYLPVFEENIVKPALPSHSEAEKVLMMGNEFVKNTWYKKYSHKYNLINNVSAIPTSFPDALSRKSNFLFISSIGQVHRGLDLLLDIFSRREYRQNKLYVCSLFNQETDFTSLYKNELFFTENINPIGYVNIRSNRFKELISDCDYVILPSCSEGQSSSVINTIRMGLIPVITENVGLPDFSGIGITIEDTTIEKLKEAINKAINLNDDEFFSMRDGLKKYVHLFDEGAFVSKLSKVLDHKND